MDDERVDDERVDDERSLHDPAQAGPAGASRRGLPSRRTGGRRVDASEPGGLSGGVDETALALAHRIIGLASDKKAADIVLLDVRGQTAMTDYFVICSGLSDRQLAAIADGIVAGTKEGGSVPLGREGHSSSHWVLIDYGSVIVHVMSAPERAFYQLEKLWSDAALLVHLL